MDDYNFASLKSREGRIRCKAFSFEGMRLNRVRVDYAGGGHVIVSVWDSVAGYFTRCHTLSKRAEKRIAAIIGRFGYLVENISVKT